MSPISGNDLQLHSNMQAKTIINRFVYRTMVPARNLVLAAIPRMSQSLSHPEGGLWPHYFGTAMYSKKVSQLKGVIPDFWIMKMKTGFSYLDLDGDGYISETDYVGWIKGLARSFPDMTEEQRKLLESKHTRVWGNLLDGKGKGPEYKVDENMYIEKVLCIVNEKGSEDTIRNEWLANFTVMDCDQDGVISKAEHRCFIEAGQHKPNGHIVAFSAIDQDMDGKITRDEYADAGVEFFFNFVDETKRSKYFFGPLVQI